MNFWDVLGIEPTMEMVDIKRAYARQLKLHHPEDDPQGFQMLREAYDSALKLAKFAKDNPSFTYNYDETDHVVTELIEETNRDPVVSSNNHEDEAQKFLSDQVLKTQFLREIEELYSDFFRRIVLENWQALFDNIDIWNINIRHQLSNSILFFIADHPYLPIYIWNYLDEYFCWNKQADNFDYQAPVEIIESITERITGTNAPWYALFKKIDDFDYEKFLVSREIALNSSMEDILGEASEYYIAHAKAVYPEDPQLNAFAGMFYFKKHDYYKAKSYLEKSIQTDSGDRTIPVLLFQTNQEIRSSLGRELFKQPWRKDLIRQYFLIDQETKKLKKAYAIHKDLEKQKDQNTSRITIIFLAIAFFFLIRAIFNTNIIKENKTSVLLPEINNTIPNEPVSIINPVPIRLTEANIDQIKVYQEVQVRFDSVMNLITLEDQSTRDIVALGRLNQKEIIIIGEADLLANKDLYFTGMVFEGGSASLVETVRQELFQIDAPIEKFQNLVTDKYIMIETSIKQ